MDKTDLLKRLYDQRYEHFRLIGLPPFKCKQVTDEKLEAWKKLSPEELLELLEHGEPEY